jgi:hypothetical protein
MIQERDGRKVVAYSVQRRPIDTDPDGKSKAR